MLEKMDEFFNSRLKGYEKHQLNEIAAAKIFYPFTAKCLPLEKNATILDLGCGTGLELAYYLPINPTAKVIGIDLAEKMLEECQRKFANYDIQLICGSYFDVPFETKVFDAAVSVESLHHFSQDEKIKLYRKLHHALKENGYFILTDYFSLSDEEERNARIELERLKKIQGISDHEFYHFDIPLTIKHEKEALIQGGFSSVEILNSFGATYVIKAFK